MSWCGWISSLYGYQRESHTCEGRYGKCFVILVHSRFMLGTELECASNMRLARLRASDPVHSRHDRCNCEIRSEQSNGDPDCHCQKERKKKINKKQRRASPKSNIPWTIRRPELSQLVTVLDGSLKFALKPPTTDSPAGSRTKIPGIMDGSASPSE